MQAGGVMRVMVVATKNETVTMGRAQAPMFRAGNRSLGDRNRDGRQPSTTLPRECSVQVDHYYDHHPPVNPHFRW